MLVGKYNACPRGEGSERRLELGPLLTLATYVHEPVKGLLFVTGSSEMEETAR